MHELTSSEWAKCCAEDGEFNQCARFWTGTFAIQSGDNERWLRVVDGAPQIEAVESAPSNFDVVYKGDESMWSEMLAATPARFFSDPMFTASLNKGLTISGDMVMHAQYYPAIARAIELLRPVAQDAAHQADDGWQEGVESVSGQYVNVAIHGTRFRMYVEIAGQGIPVLLQHTAGCHGTQWRHLMQDRRITDRFQLIAYDLPFHGKSVPPTERQWWAEPYQLTGEFLRAVPLALSRLLGLDRPVFMGCSVGGLLALDLAHKHPDAFRAVVSVEGALHIGGHMDSLAPLWHPQIGNQYKARLMEGIIAPQSPDCFRKETSWVYASGWPQTFIGDLYYYTQDYDLREQAHEIDTSGLGVHILSGEYDYSGLAELGEAAHQAIAGSTFTFMKGVGHFPMSENPEAFIDYLLPILDQLEASDTALKQSA